jgi:hypothetical protein
MPVTKSVKLVVLVTLVIVSVLAVGVGLKTLADT